MTSRNASGRTRAAAAAADTAAVPGPASGGTAGTPPADDTDAIRADIAETRAELGDTVEALAAKADVKARAKARAKDTAQAATERAKDTAEQVGETVRRRPAPLAGALAAVAAAIGAVVMVRRRRAAKTQARKRWWRSR
jgi:hypothetical protein